MGAINLGISVSEYQALNRFYSWATEVEDAG